MEQALGVTAKTLWSEVAGRLKGALNESAYRTWFGEARPVAISLAAWRHASSATTKRGHGLWPLRR